MKIFAKRKRKTTRPGEETEEPAVEKNEKRQVFQSDKVVEDLLKQDPSTWNAKQRRMVKRYQARNVESEVTSEHRTGDESKRMQAERSTLVIEPNQEDQVQQAKVDCMSDGEREEAVKESITEDQDPEEDSHCNVTKTLVDSELEKLLEKLNSKQRRKFTRMLERGASADHVRAEAVSLLDEGPETQGKSEVSKAEEAHSTTGSDELSRKKSKRRRKSAVDWSTLPPDERMRREDQRRLQKEATERRASGEGKMEHRHPLNSERRRANRRKPKYGKRLSSGNEHHTSGFQMRRTQNDRN